MKTIDIEDTLLWDEKSQHFHRIQKQQLILEHSLLSMSEWESTWEEPYLYQKAPSIEKTMDYVRCMTINNVDDKLVYRALTDEQLEEIEKYISGKNSATWFNKNINNGKRSSDIITTELVYYWMSALNIPFDPCEKWHFNRLMNLITIANLKSQPPKKMNRRQILSQNAAINAARRSRK